MAYGLRSFTIAATLVLLSFCLTLSGCGKGDDKGKSSAAESKVSKANLEKIKAGMAEKDVTDILGAPNSTKDADGGKQMKWENGSNFIEVYFKGGKVDGMPSSMIVEVKIK